MIGVERLHVLHFVYIIEDQRFILTIYNFFVTFYMHSESRKLNVHKWRVKVK